MERERMRILIQLLIKANTSFRFLIQQNMGDIDEGITFEMLHVLMFLWREDGINQQELASRIFKDKSSLSYLLTNLEKKDFIKRVIDPNDRRNKRILLTSKGIALKAKYTPFVDGVLDDLTLKINSEDVKIYIEQLHAMEEAILEISKERSHLNNKEKAL